MRKHKAILCGILAGLLLLTTACGNKNAPASNSQPTTSGRYVQTNITPEGVSGTNYLFQPTEDTLVCFNQDFTKKFESKDNGDTWTESEGPGKKATILGSASALTMTPNGTIIAAVPSDDDVPKEDPASEEEAANRMATEIPPREIIQVTPKGEVTNITPDDFLETIQENNGVFVNELKALDNERYLMTYFYNSSAPSFDEETAGGTAEEGITNVRPPETEESLATSTNEQTSEINSAPNDNGEEPEEAEEDEAMAGLGYAALGGVYSPADKKMLYPVDHENAIGFAANSTHLFLYTFTNEIDVYDIKDGKKAKTISTTVEPDFTIMNNSYCASNDGQLYSANYKNIEKIDANGKSSTLVDGVAYAFGTPSNYIQNFYALPDNQFIMSLNDGETSTLYRYVYDASATLDPNKTLTVWSLEENSALRVAIGQFMKKNDDIQVLYETGKSSDGGQSTEDALRTLNTRILAGEGPDVMMLDGCPIESYIEKGLLADISKVNTGDMYSSLQDAFKTEKGTFAFPTRFAMPILIGEKENLAKISDFASLEKYATDGPTLPKSSSEDGSLPRNFDAPVHLAFESQDEIFNYLWNSNYGNIVQENKLNTENLSKFLTAYKNLATKNNLLSAKNINSFGAMMAAFGTSAEASLIIGSPNAYVQQYADSCLNEGSDLYVYTNLLAVPGSEIKALPSINDPVFIPKIVLGVNANSKAQPLATQFIEHVLSPDCQNIRTTLGLPVNKQSIGVQLDEINKALVEYGEPAVSIDMDSIVEQCNVASMPDPQLHPIFFDAANQYVADEKTLEEVVSLLEQQLQNYLAERQ